MAAYEKRFIAFPPRADQSLYCYIFVVFYNWVHEILHPLQPNMSSILGAVAKFYANPLLLIGR